MGLNLLVWIYIKVWKGQWKSCKLTKNVRRERFDPYTTQKVPNSYRRAPIKPWNHQILLQNKYVGQHQGSLLTGIVDARSNHHLVHLKILHNSRLGQQFGLLRPKYKLHRLLRIWTRRAGNLWQTDTFRQRFIRKIWF